MRKMITTSSGLSFKKKSEMKNLTNEKINKK